MQQKDLIDKLAAATGVKKNAVKDVLDQAATVLQADLQANGETTILGFGKLKITAVAQRSGRNPATGAAIEIPARNKVSYHASAGIKAAVNS